MRPVLQQSLTDNANLETGVSNHTQVSHHRVCTVHAHTTWPRLLSLGLHAVHAKGIASALFSFLERNFGDAAGVSPFFLFQLLVLMADTAPVFAGVGAEAERCRRCLILDIFGQIDPKSLFLLIR